jgi:hypothetical protein
LPLARTRSGCDADPTMPLAYVARRPQGGDRTAVERRGCVDGLSRIHTGKSQRVPVPVPWPLVTTTTSASSASRAARRPSGVTASGRRRSLTDVTVPASRPPPAISDRSPRRPARRLDHSSHNDPVPGRCPRSRAGSVGLVQVSDHDRHRVDGVGVGQRL